MSSRIEKYSEIFWGLKTSIILSKLNELTYQEVWLRLWASWFRECTKADDERRTDQEDHQLPAIYKKGFFKEFRKIILRLLQRQCVTLNSYKVIINQFLKVICN
jgi:hypothetical protein